MARSADSGDSSTAGPLAHEPASVQYNVRLSSDIGKLETDGSHNELQPTLYRRWCQFVNDTGQRVFFGDFHDCHLARWAPAYILSWARLRFKDPYERTYTVFTQERTVRFISYALILISTIFFPFGLVREWTADYPTEGIRARAIVCIAVQEGLSAILMVSSLWLRPHRRPYWQRYWFGHHLLPATIAAMLLTNLMAFNCSVGTRGIELDSVMSTRVVFIWACGVFSLRWVKCAIYTFCALAAWGLCSLALGGNCEFPGADVLLTHLMQFTGTYFLCVTTALFVEANMRKRFLLEWSLASCQHGVEFYALPPTCKCVPRLVQGDGYSDDPDIYRIVHRKSCEFSNVVIGGDVSKSPPSPNTAREEEEVVVVEEDDGGGSTVEDSDRLPGPPPLALVDSDDDDSTAALPNEEVQDPDTIHRESRSDIVSEDADPDWLVEDIASISDGEHGEEDGEDTAALGLSSVMYPSVAAGEGKGEGVYAFGGEPESQPAAVSTTDIIESEGDSTAAEAALANAMRNQMQGHRLRTKEAAANRRDQLRLYANGVMLAAFGFMGFSDLQAASAGFISNDVASKLITLRCLYALPPLACVYLVMVFPFGVLKRYKLTTRKYLSLLCSWVIGVISVIQVVVVSRDRDNPDITRDDGPDLWVMAFFRVVIHILSTCNVYGYSALIVAMSALAVYTGAIGLMISIGSVIDKIVGIAMLMIVGTLLSLRQKHSASLVRSHLRKLGEYQLVTARIFTSS